MGTNPSFVTRNGAHAAEELPPQQECLLHHKDVLNVFLTEFPLEVRILSHAQPRKRRRAEEEEEERTVLMEETKLLSLASDFSSVASSRADGSSVWSMGSSLSASPSLVDSDPQFSLAFPSFSTGAFHFDIERASKIIDREVKSFLASHSDPRIRLTLVDVTDSEILQRVRSLRNPQSDPRFSVQVCDIVSMRSMGGKPCAFIANAANARFSAKSSGVNKAIFQAAGAEELQRSTKSVCPAKASVGVAYPVKLHQGSPLLKEGVQHVWPTPPPTPPPSSHLSLSLSKPHCIYVSHFCCHLHDFHSPMLTFMARFGLSVVCTTSTSLSSLSLLFLSCLSLLSSLSIFLTYAPGIAAE